jgi:hypothetical protein
VIVHRQEHDPKNACQGLDPVWMLVFGKHPANNLNRDPLQLNWITVRSTDITGM